MKVFLDFESSSLSDRSHPVEVAWVFEDGRSEDHLITPAPGWVDWDPASEAVHGISRETLAIEGGPADVVAARMVEALSGHDLFASAPSWDGKWLSVLLRQAGFPRRALRLRDTDEAVRATVSDILAAMLRPDEIAAEVDRILKATTAAKSARPAHRALADALGERQIWLGAKEAAFSLIRRPGR